MKKEALRSLPVTDKDRKFKALAELDGDEASLEAGEELAREEKRIVGRASRNSIDKEVLGENNKLTTE